MLGAVGIPSFWQLQFGSMETKCGRERLFSARLDLGTLTGGSDETKDREADTL